MPNRPEVVMLWHLLERLLIFPKGLLGGLIAATVMWMAVIFYSNWQASRNVEKAGIRRTDGRRWRLAISRPSPVGCCVALGCLRLRVLPGGFLGSSSPLSPPLHVPPKQISANSHGK